MSVFCKIIMSIIAALFVGAGSETSVRFTIVTMGLEEFVGCSTCDMAGVALLQIMVILYERASAE